MGAVDYQFAQNLSGLHRDDDLHAILLGLGENAHVLDDAHFVKVPDVFFYDCVGIRLADRGSDMSEDRFFRERCRTRILHVDCANGGRFRRLLLLWWRRRLLRARMHCREQSD